MARLWAGVSTENKADVIPRLRTTFFQPMIRGMGVGLPRHKTEWPTMAFLTLWQEEDPREELVVGGLCVFPFN